MCLQVPTKATALMWQILLQLVSELLNLANAVYLAFVTQQCWLLPAMHTLAPACTRWLLPAVHTQGS